MCKIIYIFYLTYWNFPCIFGQTDYYCDLDKKSFSLLPPGTQFTRDLSSREYGVLASFKSLHCCAKSYRSIEWFKDGKAYPWTRDESNLILYPESANQTIYTEAMGPIDNGNYKCEVSTSDFKTFSHTISLTVFDTKKNYMDMPLETYHLEPLQFVQVGSMVKLYCEAFVGKIDLPDAESEAKWVRTGFNMSSPEAQRYRQHKVYREDNQVIGAYLVIDKVKRSDLGEFECSISNTEDQVLTRATILMEKDSYVRRKIPWLKLQLIMLVALVMVSLILACKRYVLSARLFLKLKFCRPPVDDGKNNDVLLCYSMQDSDFAQKVLSQTLRSCYGYSVITCLLNAARSNAELQLAARTSRKLLVVMSPSLFENQWTPSNISPFLRELASIHPSIILVSTVAILTRESWKTAEDKVLAKQLSEMTVLLWNDCLPLQQHNLWTRLRLSLPPPQPAGEAPEPQLVEFASINPAATSVMSDCLEVMV